MLRRVFAWILIAGFVLLVSNILFIGWKREACAYVYLVIAASFFIFRVYGRNRSNNAEEE